MFRRGALYFLGTPHSCFPGHLNKNIAQGNEGHKLSIRPLIFILSSSIQSQAWIAVAFQFTYTCTSMSTATVPTLGTGNLINK